MNELSSLKDHTGAYTDCHDTCADGCADACEAEREARRSAEQKVRKCLICRDRVPERVGGRARVPQVQVHLHVAQQRHGMSSVDDINPERQRGSGGSPFVAMP